MIVCSSSICLFLYLSGGSRMKWLNIRRKKNGSTMTNTMKEISLNVHKSIADMVILISRHLLVLVWLSPQLNWCGYYLHKSIGVDSFISSTLLMMGYYYLQKSRDVGMPVSTNRLAWVVLSPQLYDHISIWWLSIIISINFFMGYYWFCYFNHQTIGFAITTSQT